VENAFHRDCDNSKCGLVMFPRTADRRGKSARRFIVAVGIGAYGLWRWGSNATPQLTTASASTEKTDSSSTPVRDRDSVDLSDTQLAAVKVEPVEEHAFPIEKEAVAVLISTKTCRRRSSPLIRADHRSLRLGWGRCEEGADPVHDRQPGSAAGRVYVDCRRRSFGADHAQSGAPARTL